MNRWIVAAAIPLVLGIALAACNGSGGDTTFGDGGPCPDKAPPSAQIDADMGVEELIDLVAEAITCPGYAFHMRSAGGTESGPYSSYSETEVWVDMENNRGRVEQRFRFTSEEALAEAAEDGYDPEFRSTEIVRSDGRYSSQQNEQPAGKGRLPGCHDPGQEALGLVLPCFDGPLQYFEISIDPNGSYNGHDAIAYVAEGESSGSDETYYTTSRLYFRQDKFMPIGATREGTLDIGEIFPVQADFPYETGFVPLDSLPSDFFDPASIGYVEPDPYDVERPLDDAEIDVYWLGRDFQGGGEYPTLTLARSSSHSTLPEGELVVEMSYRPIEEEFDPPAVRIVLLTNDAWEYREEHTSHDPCDDTVDFDVLGGTATIRKHFDDGLAHLYLTPPPRPDDCPPPDRYSAVVHFDDVVVDIDAPRRTAEGTPIHSAYDSEEGMELLVRSLVLRE